MKKNSAYKLSILATLVLLTMVMLDCSCSGNKKTGDEVDEPIPYSEMKAQYHKPLMDWNKEVVGIEKDIILKYAERRNWDITESGTGLYYDIYFKGDGRKAIVGDNAEFAYAIYLMDGTLLYCSDSSGNRQILLGHNTEENGIDEAIQMMNIGDKAHLILPPHLAFGVPGDGFLVPPRTILVYNIELLNIL